MIGRIQQRTKRFVNKDKAKHMTSIKQSGKKIRIAARGKRRSAPRWADIRKFGLKRARTRRIGVDGIRNWRRSKMKV